MASATVEPIQSFAYLCDNIPQWLTKLEELGAQCDEQYERFYRSTKHGEVKLTRNKKHQSTETLRTRDNNNNLVVVTPGPHTDESPTLATGGGPAAPTESAPTPPPLTTPAPLTSTHPTLKRKQSSIVSAASGRDGYRSKSMIVVYYDSAIQESFESIVNDVSSARSTLRKGRTTALFHSRMAAMAAVSSSSENTDSLAPSSKFLMPSFGRRKEDATEKQKCKVYDEADRDLEEAQNLSEKAAHQFLRDGDCRTQMGAMKKRFHAVQEMAEKEVERLKQLREKEEEEEQQGATSAKSVEVPPQPAAAAAAAAAARKADMPRIVGPPTYPNLLTSLSPSAPVDAGILPSKQMHFAATGVIEVDDAASDESSIKIDINAIRRVTRRAV